MRRLAFAVLLVLPVLTGSVSTALALPNPVVTERYGTISRPAHVWPSASLNEWDVTACDLTVSYRLSMGRYRPPLGTTAWTSVGVGNATDPKAWMSSGAPYAAQALPRELDLDDKFNLGAPGRLDEWTYDATAPGTIVGAPIGNPAANYGIWFDRTGVAAAQLSLWGLANRATYNTAGNYLVEIVFHAVTSGKGTAFATVNGARTGFYNAAWVNAAPTHMPVGKSFSADMTRLRVFASVAGSSVRVSSLTARGCR